MIDGLLGDLAAEVHSPPGAAGAASSLWAASGAMSLTGRPGGEPRLAPGDPAGAVSALLSVWRRHVAQAPAGGEPDHRLLGERAALAGLGRRGTVSCGGGSRILRAADGWLVLSLSRPVDVETLPALLGTRLPRLAGAVADDEVWATVAAWSSRTPVEVAASRVRLLGMAGGPVAAPASGRSGPAVRAVRGPHRPARGSRRLRVLDLSGLWAGPLCTHLLGLGGADVVTVESPSRLDGTRHGAPRFHDLLRHGTRSVAMELAGADGRRDLLRLIGGADVVVSGSRARALQQLGLDPARAVADGTTWVAITAHGQGQPDRIGFGDDVAAEAGLVVRTASGPLFCGDALADPLTGVTAAAAVAVAVSTGHAWHLEVSMADVCQQVAALSSGVDPAAGEPVAVAAPYARAVEGPAPRPGMHTAEVLRDWG